MSNVETMGDDELLEHIANLPDDEVEVETEDEEDVAEDIEDTEEYEDEELEEDTDEVIDDEPQETSEDEESEDEEESQEESEENEEESEDTEEETPETDAFNYKDFYEQVTSEYKANGKVMPGIKDPEDFKRALSMAANYAQKTTALKPHLGRVKMLQDVTDDELNEMMDFRNRDPEVIKKAMQDAKLDPMEIDIDEEVQYTARDHRLSQEQIEFEEIVDPLRNTPEFDTVTEVVTKLWDARSSKELMDNPTLLAGLHEEITMGRFEPVQTKLDQLRSLGKGDGMTDLELYKAIAQDMVDNAPSKPDIDSAPQKEVQDPVRNAQRKKAGIKHKKPAATKAKEYDPTLLSDEAFTELVESGAKFINK